jgi:F-type H+-transporting ATPase subunit b
VSINLTLLGQMITFLLFVWFTQRFVWPPLMKALKDRQDKIAAGLAAAEKGHAALMEAEQKIASQLKDSKTTANEIISGAKKQADAIVDGARTNAHEEASRIIQQANAEVAHMVEEAKESLRKQVATLALRGAEKILSQAVDPATHQAMLDQLAKEM